MRGQDFFKAALILAAACIASYITGGRIPYSIFFICLGVISVDLIWAVIGTRTTASCWVETYSVQAGAKIKLFTEIKNNSGLPLPWVQCWIDMPGTFGLPDNMCCYTFSLGPYEKKIVTEEMECRLRGKFRWGECFIRTGGLLGFFINTGIGGQHREIQVMPKLFNIGSLGTEKDRVQGKLKGSPQSVQDNTGLFSIRDYTSADGVTRIHWKMSARFQQLMVKDYQQVNVGYYMLILDNCRENHVGDGPEASFEKAVSLAASTAVSALKAGAGISLLPICRPDASLETSMGSGKASLAAILSILTELDLKDLKDTISQERANFIDFVRCGEAPFIWITGNLHNKIAHTLIQAKPYCRDSIIFLLQLETFGEVKVNLTERQETVCRLRALGIKVITVSKELDLRLLMGRSLYGIS